MTPKQRIMNLLLKGQADYIPWVLRMDLWYNYHKKRNILPEVYKNLSIWDIHRELDLAFFNRGGKIFAERIKDLKVKILYTERNLEKEFSPALLNYLLAGFKHINEIPVELTYSPHLKPPEIKIQYLYLDRSSFNYIYLSP